MYNKMRVGQSLGILCAAALLTTHCVVNPGDAPAVPAPTVAPVQVATTPTPDATTSPAVAEQPAINTEAGLMQAYENEEGGFSLRLPTDWTVREAEEAPYGSVYQLGPDPLAASGPSNSTIVVANAGEITVEELAEQLQCGGGCEVPELTDVTLRSGIPAQQAIIGGAGAPETTWTFVEQGDTLLGLSIHAPEDPTQPLAAITESLVFGPLLESGGEEFSAVQAARQDLAQQIEVNPYTILLDSVEPMEWPDSCLGVAQEGVMCAQVVTPGYRVVLRTDDETYTYHTDETGTQVILAPEENAAGG
jgi:hypothetical protein